MKQNGKFHGICTLLAKYPFGLRQHQIAQFFRLQGCSTLTFMRRAGLITKAGEKNTTPWIITEQGCAEINKLPRYKFMCKCGAECTDAEPAQRCNQCMIEEAKWLIPSQIEAYDPPMFAPWVIRWSHPIMEFGEVSKNDELQELRKMACA
jgi:hypothetical protein